jgi:hypothetical protein
VSIPVPIERLKTALAERGATSAYLLTVSEAASPHAVHVPLAWHGDALVVEVGRRTAANAAQRSAVSLLCPIRTADDYSLIIDGTATVDGTIVRIAPTKAVLHRPAASPDPTAACAHDCVPIMPAKK